MKTKHFNFNVPDDARKFLSGFCFPNGAKIVKVKLANGRKVALAKASDNDIMDFASQIYTELYSKGFGSYEEAAPPAEPQP